MADKILVTGGTGYIGSHTVVELMQTGYEVVIVDNLSNSNTGVIDGIEKIVGKRPMFVEADCADKQILSNLFKANHDIKGVIHFAASKAVGESVQKPLLYYRNNILSLITVLELMQEYDVNYLVFSSSCTVYGQPDVSHLPVDETAPIQKALSPYGNTKQINEEIIQDCVNTHSHLKATLLRYFNPIGAHPSALIGELPIGVPQNLLPYITQTAAKIRPFLQVFGDDYNTPDGSCIRDYIYVVDLAKAHVKALQHMMDKTYDQHVEIFNLGTGKGVSVFELINTFIQATGVDVPYKVVSRRDGDIEQVWADAHKANQVLGWHADTPLTQVLQSAWNWEKKR